jgi:hypothetical protein
MQPTYLPWCGYFNLIDSVDCFIFLDDVKLEKSDWHVRNRIKSANGELLLSISVNLPKGRMDTLINQALLDLSQPWKKKHLKSIYTNYRKAKYFDEIYPFIESLLLKEGVLLSTFTIDIIKAIANKLKIETKFFLASKMEATEGVKDKRLVELCHQVGASHYISPVGASAYIEKNSPGGEIVKNDILLSYQEYIHPNYHQLYKGFQSHLSIIDMLFNCGFDAASQLISNRGKVC